MHRECLLSSMFETNSVLNAFLNLCLFSAVRPTLDSQSLFSDSQRAALRVRGDGPAVAALPLDSVRWLVGRRRSRAAALCVSRRSVESESGTPPFSVHAVHNNSKRIANISIIEHFCNKISGSMLGFKKNVIPLSQTLSL